ncbi:SusD/RagB family nutrient-binding outer membrane lipoprotein [Riemerella anatipestifer]|uniref:SusD/RagB family nutrient-binding outer membrane lipoprotein n=1 Tax=Riemerella anatipestifer TaxID=34085 RepID=UPI001374B2D0|nr:SusD/RagB family nutrient-binding outer membrane lipoprotein [Riemerella anatipestifer]
MKKIILAIITLSVIPITNSCRQDFEAINASPNSPQAPLSYGLFNSANKELMDGMRGGFPSGRVALPWVQYSAQRNYTEEDKFQYRLTSGDAFWNTFYLTAQDYKNIITLNEDPKTKDEMSQYGSNKNQIAAARIMLSYVFSNLVDRFGDVPYYSYGNKDADFQALDVNNVTPKFASQEKIYADILKELKEASEMIDLNNPVFNQGDMLFGSPVKMKRFANSLRLRIANRVKGVISGAEGHIRDAIASGVMESNDDSVGLKYENNKTNPSPMYSAFFVDNRTDFSVSNTFIELLKGERGNFGLDPRLQKYAAPNNVRIAEVGANSYAESDDLSLYKGMPYGLPANGWTASQRSSSSFFSSNVLKADYTEMLMEYSEVCFILSEVNGWDNDWYKKGVKASMDKWGVTSAKSTAFVASLPVANKANVLNQKYIALYMQPQEAWSEYRRTGYPNTLLKVGESHALNAPYKTKVNGVETTYTSYTFNSLVPGLTDLPARLYYPAQPQTLNTENYKAASIAIGGDKMDTKLIWDKN